MSADLDGLPSEALAAQVAVNRMLGNLSVALEASSDDAGSPVRPADGLSGPEVGRDGEGL